ncbi:MULTISPECIES: hypothetical protein [Mycobacterium]|uniref:DUF3592 domain-containing protein n=1 Tax=Mycobacterium kiyosense TaxID=2871094 RepID=A0A9P3Q892_9MYCO|nr:MULTISPECIES: hypothetical protein [Mycobacterium]BDB45086.1 hypothetical protein IWGMT90018_55320 [Mycobacterium kiyosense]BDE16563.1 hypothetical protein MKCMC460_54230 [Mycobacterium sp. 20KCMC460]GLB84543.1 hypothetical protein SRL2020028_37990 [Mycobacterium kiyosense]GLB92011.1 hypothetical protein SRL2020130_48280 [Mycobacterium kiyosense]GLB96525.1 hypothetical protein SRL2020226_33010 [Mycobacterium kiyosense]
MEVAHALGIVPRVGHFLNHPYVYGPIILALLAFIFVRDRKRRNPEIRGTALTGTARVLSVKQVGGGGDEHQYRRLTVRLGLRVEIAGRQPYDVDVERDIDLIHVPRVQVGATIPVQVDPADPQKVRFEFGQPSA